MSRPLRISAPKPVLYSLRFRLALALFVSVLYKQYHLFSIYRDALAAKYSTTEFSLDFIAQHWHQWIRDEKSAYLQDRTSANQAAWMSLGKGWENETVIHHDSVIKTFRPAQSPFRNCAPSTADDRWPTEIPASLCFGGTDSNLSTFDVFLPVKTYSLAVPSASHAEWHLITPLLSDGTLKDLCTHVRRKGKLYRDVDTFCRPSFELLLDSLKRLHDAGYCHDDIKPTTMLVTDQTRWILGHLGNPRHLSHPYHSSLLWRENRQRRDCRAVDNVRALKSYIRFVRDSALDSDTFKANSFAGREPLSRLFWSTTVNSSHLSAKDLRVMSTSLHPQSETKDVNESSNLVRRPSYMWLRMFARRWSYHFAVNEMLQTRVDENLGRWWAMTPLFGVPVPKALAFDLTIFCINILVDMLKSVQFPGRAVVVPLYRLFKPRPGTAPSHLLPDIVTFIQIFELFNGSGVVVV